MFLFSLFQSNYGLIIGVTVGAIIVFAVIVVGVILLARRQNMKEYKLGEKKSSNPNIEEFVYANESVMYRGNEKAYTME